MSTDKEKKRFRATEPVVIYSGPRGADFKEMISNVLKLGKIKQKYIDILTNEDSLKYYNSAFTAYTADTVNNYEFYEQLGDASAGNFIVWYMYKRFPQLKCEKGIKVVSRLKGNYGSKQTFFKIAEQLGFWPFISASVEQRSKEKKSLLEDSMEAFIGVTESLIDMQFRHGIGYCIVYDILSAIFDGIPISLKYEDLIDAKTRLKELFDAYKNLGKLEYIDSRDDMFAYSQALLIPPEKDILDEHTKRYIQTLEKQINTIENTIKDIRYKFPKKQIGSGQASLKIDAQQRAAENALLHLENLGYKRPIPEEYKYFDDLAKKTN